MTISSQAATGQISQRTLAFVRIWTIFQLGKPLLSFHIALSALIGALLASPVFERQAATVFFGVFFLASCGAVFNNIQDSQYDQIFIRTQKRALPSGLVSQGRALQLALIYGMFAVFFLGTLSKGIVALLIGCSGLVLYNLIYTPLKKRTIYALFPGILCGMLPPFIGWVGHGGSGLSTKIMAFACCIGIWQIPHTMSIQRQNRSSLLRSSWPNLVEGIPPHIFSSAMLLWTNAYAISLATMPLFGLTHSTIPTMLLLSAGFLGQYICMKQIRKITHSEHKPTFLSLRRYLSLSLLTMLITLFLTHY